MLRNVKLLILNVSLNQFHKIVENSVGTNKAGSFRFLTNPVVALIEQSSSFTVK